MNLKLLGDVVAGLERDRIDRFDFECLHEALRLALSYAFPRRLIEPTKSWAASNA
ncbi:hypothetical protein NB311A_13116 [Nitrobacter sp. Nb-311A]|jgi:hypothetical protein|nr:hypothetical protein NB311A_13116 [Nitrobacter sp. Nb-311A]